MEYDVREMSLETLALVNDGRVNEQFQYAFNTLLRECRDNDVKRDGKGFAAGVLTLKIKVEAIRPDLGDAIHLSFQVDTAPPKRAATNASLMKLGRKFVVDCTPERQVVLPLENVS